MLNDMMTLTEFCASIGISVRTGSRWAAREMIRTELRDRRVLVPRSELDRLREAREAAVERASIQARAIGLLDAAWRGSYRLAVAAIAAAGGELRDHLAAGGDEHAADRCQTCADTLDLLLVAERNARTHAGISTYVAGMHATLRAAAADADSTGAALRRDPDDDENATGAR